MGKRLALRVWIIFFIFVFNLAMNLLKAESINLADIYKTGQLILQPQLIIDESSLPAGVIFAGITSIAFDQAGNIYILDFSDENIKKFDGKGRFLKVIGQKGQGPGDLSRPTRFDIGHDKLVVWELGNRRLQALTLDGEAITSRQVFDLSGQPQQLRVFPDGDIVVETLKTYFDDINKPQDVFLEILSSDLKTKKILYSHQVWKNKFLKDEKFGLTNIPQPFSPVVCWDLMPDGRVAIGFSAQYEFGIYSKQGDLLRSVSHSFEPVRVTEKDKKTFFESMSFADGQTIKKGAPDYIIKNTDFPKYKPAYRQIMVDGEGNILVFPYLEDEAKQAFVFDAFTPEGQFISRVEIIEPRVSFLGPGTRWQGKSVWLRKIDEDGKMKFIKYIPKN